MAHPPSIVMLGDHQYKLVPFEDKDHQPPTLRSYDEDRTFEATQDYKYTNLEGSQRKIRLLQLKSGAISDTDIYCELMEADFDNRFHLPIAAGAPEKYMRPHETMGKSTYEIDEEAFKALREYEIKFEALSWCWGTDTPNHLIFINQRDKNGQDKLYKLRVRKELALALKYLRYPNKSRTLWIDAICINQDDPSERNHQVQLMSRIYTLAQEVCIWLGEGDGASKLAIPFIKNEIMEWDKFKTLFSDNRYTAKWRALVVLMQRNWFSRRWVVQEIALATKATIYCGDDFVEWGQFAVAIEHFVDVESATRRLSEVMQQDVKLGGYLPGWFEYVSALGASLLVDATGKVFRARSAVIEGDVPYSSGDLMQRLRLYKNLDLLDRRKLLSLEYLVTTLFIFGASEPRDVVYSMLALSRDAAPLASSGPTSGLLHKDPTRLLLTTCDPLLTAKPFPVDYRRPYTEFCKDFVSFAIERKRETDPSQALDILCRPWALPPRPGKSNRLHGVTHTVKRNRLLPPRDAEQRPWTRRSIDSNGTDLENDPRLMEDYWKAVEKPDAAWERMRDRYFPSRESQVYSKWEQSDDMPLPSWVAKVSRAPIMLYFSPGIEPQIAGRSNADPLVGHPKDNHRNYCAAQTQPPKLLQFRRRPRLNHYSLFVNGFVIDEVQEVVAASQGGNIPNSWLELAGWNDVNEDPPNAFWRTLVADRGRDNRTPPYYYARACRESAIRGGTMGGRIDTAALINNERNPILTEFCRRVHAVIWSRRLFKTKTGRLGLAFDVEKGDELCILYGCTVPVVLRQHSKTHQELVDEAEEDSVMALRRRIQKMEILRQRKAAHIDRKLSSEILERNRSALKSANKKIKALGRTPWTIRKGNSGSENISRDREDEISRFKTGVRSEREDQDSEDESQEGEILNRKYNKCNQLTA